MQREASKKGKLSAVEIMNAFPERTPVKLEFNHPELESLALEHL